MASLASVLGLNGIQAQEPSLVVLDMVLGRSAIILNDVGTILGTGADIPIPLVGLQYQIPERVELLKYKASKYPALNRQVVSNTLIKEERRFSIVGIRGYTRFNNAITGFALNEATRKILEEYADNGGTFTIVTMWGVIKNCIMERLDGVKIHDKDIGGQGFEFGFCAINVQTELTEDQNQFLKSLTSGGV